MTTTRRPTIASERSKPKPKPKPNPASAVSRAFRQWLQIRDDGNVLSDRQGALRDRLVDSVREIGDSDEKGNIFVDLPSPVSFTDHKGKTFVYTTLKAERHLSPAQPTPDPDLAEELLREKGLWLTEDQEAAIQALRLLCPYAVIDVTVDTEAVTGAYFKGAITEGEFDGILREQKETFQFRPSES